MRRYVTSIVANMTICKYFVLRVMQFVRFRRPHPNKLMENAKTSIILEEKFFGYCHFVVTLHREQHKAFI